MRILKLISALLSYPQAELWDALDEIAARVEVEPDLPEPKKARLAIFISIHRSLDLIDWQQRYVELFDRGRALSLLIFEHIHGESRDRGQAMVDLLSVYHTYGFQIASRELPDHIPLFLEFLSQIPKDEAQDLLSGALPVLNLLGARLSERNSPYAVLFDALSSLAGDTSEQDALLAQAAAERPDDCLVRMDEIWEEEAVSFLGNTNTCKARTTQPLKYNPCTAPGA